MQVGYEANEGMVGLVEDRVLYIIVAAVETTKQFGARSTMNVLTAVASQCQAIYAALNDIQSSEEFTLGASVVRLERSQTGGNWWVRVRQVGRNEWSFPCVMTQDAFVEDILQSVLGLVEQIMEELSIALPANKAYLN